MTSRVLIVGLVAVASVGACSSASSGNGDATPITTFTSRSASEQANDDCIVDAMLGFDVGMANLKWVKPGDIDPFLTKVAQKYGTHSRNMDVITWAYTQTGAVVRHEIPVEQVYEGIKRGCANGAPAALGKPETTTRPAPTTSNAQGGWPQQQATTLPGPEAAPRDDLITCEQVIYYYAPLLAKDPKNEAIIMRNSYGGSAYGQLDRQMMRAAADPRLSTDAKAVAQDACRG